MLHVYVCPPVHARIGGIDQELDFTVPIGLPLLSHDVLQHVGIARLQILLQQEHSHGQAFV